MSDAGDNARHWRVLIGTNTGYSALVRAALQHHHEDASQLLVLFGVDEAFPFRPRPSTILVPGMPAGVIASIPPLEEMGIASRLASTAGLPGCYDGTVTELAEVWLRTIESERAPIIVSATGMTVRAVEELGRALEVPVTNVPE